MNKAFLTKAALLSVSCATMIACFDSNESSTSASKDQACAQGLELLPYNSETFPYAQASKNLSKKTPLAIVTNDTDQEFDIIIRDFEVNHPDFENFTEEALVSMGKDERFGINTWLDSYLGNAEWLGRRNDNTTYGCGSVQSPALGLAMGSEGYPKEIMTPSGATTTLPAYLANISSAQGYAWYGEFARCTQDPELNPLGLEKMRGSAAELCSDNAESWDISAPDSEKSCSKICQVHVWSKPVYITPGMVKQQLQFKHSEDGEIDFYSPEIERNRLACDNEYFDHWFHDEGSVNKRSNTTMVLSQSALDPKYVEIRKDWNNGGFFPLDSVSDDGNFYFIESKPGLDQYGPQSLSINCPPYNYLYASSQTDFLGKSTSDLCKFWQTNGGPKNKDAAFKAAMTSPFGISHLRNYGFTIMGFIPFEYHKDANEIFQFTGDDDMWIFVDGVLAVDLGGTHLPATGTIRMDYLAVNSHGCHEGEPMLDSCVTKVDEKGVWKDSSVHYIHFFHAERQSDGSNFKIRSSISKVNLIGKPSQSDSNLKEENLYEYYSSFAPGELSTDAKEGEPVCQIPCYK